MDEKKIKEIKEHLKGRTTKCLLPSCNAEIPQDALYCPMCGSRQVPWVPNVKPPTQDRKCPHCHKQLNDTDILLCSHCAGLLDSTKSTLSQETRSPTLNTSTKKDLEDIGFTRYNDLYSKKSYSQAKLEEYQEKTQHLTKEEKEKVYKRHAISPFWGLIIVPINMLIYYFLDGGSMRYFFSDWHKLFTRYAPVSIIMILLIFILSAPIIYLFAIWAIHHNKKWRHKLNSYDLKRDAKDTAAIVALGVATKGAVKNSKDLVTKPLKPEEAHF